MPELEIRGNDIRCTQQTAPHCTLFTYIKDIVNYSAMSTFHVLEVEFCDWTFAGIVSWMAGMAGMACFISTHWI